MRALRLRLDSRGRILLPPPLRALCGLRPAMKLAVSMTEDALLVRPTATPDRRPPTLDRKGRLTLPLPLRAELGLATGATLLVQAAPPGLRLATPAGLLARQREARLALERRLAALELQT